MVERHHLVAHHPAFADEGMFPAARISFWSTAAEHGLPAARFKQPVALAHSLYVAHQLAIDAQTAVGGLVGVGVGRARVIGHPSRTPKKRKKYKVFASNGRLPKEFDTPDTEHKRGGVWNSTAWGQRLHLISRY